MLYYLPLEPYIERYTYLMSAKDGWAEENFKRYHVPFTRVDGKSLGNTIKTGVVLDACGRSYYALSQIQEIINLINNGKVNDDDVIYVEDFWHPGIESLFYIRHLCGINFKIGTFIHAQSVDDTDFSYAMRYWMRPIETGFGRQYDFIFTCSDILRNLCIDAGITTPERIHTVGLPYNSEVLLRQLKDMGFVGMNCKKEDYVLFSSRFDDEKDPMFFLDLVEACPDVEFRLVNPRKDRPITSNKNVMNRLDNVLKNCSNFSIITTYDKISYYNALAKAKVVFNCANQDWVSWTLLEAVTFKCLPLYPVWKDFPLELNYDNRFLYQKRNLNDCISKLMKLLEKDFNDEDVQLDHIINKHDASWKKFLQIMGEIN